MVVSNFWVLVGCGGAALSVHSINAYGISMTPTHAH